MTDETQIVPIRPSSPLAPSEARGLAVEVAKSLKLVASASMSAEQQTVWLHAAVDALEDIRPEEVRSVSAELRRTVTRPAQIVPEIARLVSEKRSRANRVSAPSSPFADEMEINREAQERRARAHGSRSKMDEAFEWEREARVSAGLHVPPRELPLSSAELENMAPHVRQMGLASGFLAYRDGRLVEA